VQELVALLGDDVQVDFSHPKGEEAVLARAALGAKGPVLIAWEHEGIPDIVAALGPASPAPPASWPGSRFDMVWVFDRDTNSGTWTFTQVPQLLLSKDSKDPI
jgi:hypothetical protein